MLGGEDESEEIRPLTGTVPLPGFGKIPRSIKFDDAWINASKLKTQEQMLKINEKINEIFKTLTPAEKAAYAKSLKTTGKTLETVTSEKELHEIMRLKSGNYNPSPSELDVPSIPRHKTTYDAFPNEY